MSSFPKIEGKYRCDSGAAIIRSIPALPTNVNAANSIDTMEEADEIAWARGGDFDSWVMVVCEKIGQPDAKTKVWCASAVHISWPMNLEFIMHTDSRTCMEGLKTMLGVGMDVPAADTSNDLRSHLHQASAGKLSKVRI